MTIIHGGCFYVPLIFCGLIDTVASTGFVACFLHGHQQKIKLNEYNAESWKVYNQIVF